MNEKIFSLSSPAFEHNGLIPSVYTCDGKNINPDLSIQGVPEGAMSLAHIMDDPDIPDFVKEKYNITEYIHWVVFNIDPSITEILENTEPSGISGQNGVATHGYTGPCPPDRQHRYMFNLYALDIMLELPAGATKVEVLKAMEGHILAHTTLIGLYERQ